MQFIANYCSDLAYCVLFDSSARKSEIHSTMIDKCVQARRPRRSSLKQQDVHLQRDLQEVVQVSPPFLVSHQGDGQHLERKDSSIIVNENVYNEKGRLGVQIDNCTTEVVHVTSPYLMENPSDNKHSSVEDDDDDDDDASDELVIQQQ